MLHIGCHLSCAKGFYAMGKQAVSLGADTFQYFTRNPRGSKAKAIDPQDAQNLCEILKEYHFAPILAHAPYTLNACSATEKTREFAKLTIQDDLRRMEYTPGQLYNFHPGSHVGQGIDEGIRQIAGMLNEILNQKQSTTVLLETMAGKGTEVGGTFEELQKILQQVDLKDKVGVCLDTCHVYDAGYNIVEDLDGVLKEFDRVIGIEKLRAIHINDSMNSLGSHKDRHQKIGEGFIGSEAFLKIVCHPQLKQLPFVLETPNDLSGYKREIDYLRQASSE